MVSQREFSFSFRHTFFLVGSSNSIKKNFYLASYFLALHCILNFWEMSHFAYVICLKTSFVEEFDKENEIFLQFGDFFTRKILRGLRFSLGKIGS